MAPCQVRLACRVGVWPAGQGLPTRPSRPSAQASSHWTRAEPSGIEGACSGGTWGRAISGVPGGGVFWRLGGVSSGLHPPGLCRSSRPFSCPVPAAQLLPAAGATESLGLSLHFPADWSLGESGGTVLAPPCGLCPLALRGDSQVPGRPPGGLLLCHQRDQLPGHCGHLATSVSWPGPLLRVQSPACGTPPLPSAVLRPSGAPGPQIHMPLAGSRQGAPCRFASTV